MNQSARKKSPRAPSLSLDDSLERAVKVYEKERCHAAATDVIAQNLGYKSANNGAALAVIASLRAYGLLEKAQEGKLAVSRDVESYQFAPTDQLKNELKIKWLKFPGIFRELLDKYADGLPSDASIRFDLIQKGFTPASAESTLNVLKQSVEFAKFYEQPRRNNSIESAQEPPSSNPQSIEHSESTDASLALGGVAAAGYDRIPVRLSGGRRAWLEIPTPFYTADKKRLNAQIDLLLTEDEGPSEN